MTDKQIHRYFAETTAYADPDAFASDVSLSLLDPEDPDQQIDMAVFDQLRTLWHIINDPFKVFLASLGLTQTQCATRFCIPLRTVQGWALGERACPSYIRLMMAELCGAVTLRSLS